MHTTPSLARVLKKVGLMGAVLAPITAQADLVDDSHLKVDMRNFYLHRDFTNSDAPSPKVGSWSQGFDLQFASGYTDTPLQFGVDVNAQYAIRLDSHGDDGTLPMDSSSGRTADDYSRAGATLKMKYSKTELRVGDMRPELPVAWHDPSRQLDLSLIHI